MTDFSSHPVKRALSVFEKSDYSHVPGNAAVVLPGSYRTEIEELMSVGVEAKDIIWVEKDEKTYRDLASCYEPHITGYHGDIVDIVSDDKPISYVHFDSCGAFDPQRLFDICRCLSSNSSHRTRLRYTAYLSRQSADVIRTLYGPYVDVLKEWLNRLHGLTGDQNYALERFRVSNEIPIAQAVSVVVALGLMTSMDSSCLGRLDSLPLPALSTTFAITSRSDWTYVEPKNPSLMYTFWIDFFRVSEQTERSASTVGNQILSLVPHGVPRFRLFS